MRKLLLILPLLAMGACSNNESKARKLITQQLKETLHNWDSYESVKSGTVDSVYTRFTDNPEYAALVAEFIETTTEMESAQEKYELYKDLGYFFSSERTDAYRIWAQKLDVAIELKAEMDRIETVFIPEFKGWSMTHSFRANNLSGNKGIHHEKFYFNKDITKITDSEDVGESAMK